MKLPIRSTVPPLIVLSCLVVLALTAFNFFGVLSPQFPNRPDYLPQESVICDGRIARMSEQRMTGTRLWVDDLHCRDGEVMRPILGLGQFTVMGGNVDAVYGDRIRFRSHLHTPHGYHNPGAIDWERKAASDGIGWTGSIESADWVMVVKPGWWSPQRMIDQWRQRLSQQIATIEDANLRGSAAALLIGDAGLLPEKFGDGLRYLGIIHLYVISGLHIAIVAWAAYGMLYWLLSRRSRWALRYPLWRWAAAGSVISVWIYVGLVGGGVSVVRAGIMATVYLIAKILDRHPHVGAAIALAALILIFQSPHVIFLPGFQLSFVAVIAIVVFCPKLKGIQWLWAALVATWATVPLVATHFHQTPLLGLPANLIAGPYTTIVLMPLGFLWTLCAGVAPLAHGLQIAWTCAAWPLVRAIEWLTPHAEHWQWTFTPTVLEVVWWYSLGFIINIPRQRRRMMIAWAAVGLIVIGCHVYDAFRDRSLQLTFLDVGQGASVLIEFPNHHTMLIDAGGAPGSDFDVGRWVIAPTLLARGITKVDDVVLTHPHPDHYGGLPYIAEHFHPDHFFTNGSSGEEGDPQWQYFSDRMRAAGMAPEFLHHGMTMQQGSTEITWRHPPVTGPDDYLGKNNGSLVADIRDGNFRALIVGDIQEEAEAQILKDPELGAVDVLQVPHHASRTSSTSAFLDRVHPTVAIAQLGFENRYGFPHGEVVKRYEDRGIQFCRNDRDGAVSVTAGFPMRQFSIQRDRSVGTCSAPAK